MKSKKNIILTSYFIFLLGILSWHFFLHKDMNQMHTDSTPQVNAQTHYDSLPKSQKEMSMNDDMNQQLKTTVKYSSDKIIISNGENADWKDCRFEINATIVQKGYIFTKALIPSRGTAEINLSDFTRDGIRFNPSLKKANNILIMCNDANGKMGWSYSSNR